MKQLGGYQRRTSVLVVVSSVTTALSLFAIFRVTAALASVQWIGVWALVQGLFLLARVSDSGAGANITRVVAVRAKDSDRLDLRNLTIASFAIASGPSTVMSVLSAPLIGAYISAKFGQQLDPGTLWAMVWIGLASAVTAALAGVLMAIPEGMFELNRKSVIVIAGNVVGVAAIVPLVGVVGPSGIAWAAVLTNATQLMLAGWRVVGLCAAEPPVSLRGVRAEIRSLWRENLNLSGVALLRLSFEPTTKVILSLFAPLSAIANFELALRFTSQIRAVAQAALQPLLAVGARSKAPENTTMQAVFARNDRALVALSLGGLIVQILAAPLVEWLGFGTYSDSFTVFVAILAAGNAVNITGLAGYYWQLASGDLYPLLRVQAIMAVINVGIGTIGLRIESAQLVVASYALAFAFGGSVARSFLTDLSVRARLASPLLICLASTSVAGTLVFVRPTSPAEVVVLALLCASVGGASLIWAYRRVRHGPA